MSLFSPKKQKNYPQRSDEENRRKQKFAIWDYYKKKNANSNDKEKKTTIPKK